MCWMPSQHILSETRKATARKWLQDRYVLEDKVLMQIVHDIRIGIVTPS